MKSLKFTKEQFYFIKDKLRNQIESKINLVPALQAYINFFSLILKDYVRNHNLISVTNYILYF